MQVPDLNIPSLLELYSRPYDESMMEWRRICAVDKAAHISELLGTRSSEIETVLEVGCGTGDVLKLVAGAGVGKDLVGVEITDERISSQVTQGNQNIRLERFDGKRLEFPDNSFDFVYATHVLEHVVYERELLHEISRVARKYVYIEVPLENHMRTSWQAINQTLKIGHINAYNWHSFLLKLETSGLKTIATKAFDHSTAVHNFGSSLPKLFVKIGLRRAALAMGFGPSMMTYHCGALCTPAARLDIS